MKVAIYSHSQDSNAGGGLVYVLSIAQALQSLGHQVTLFLSDRIPLSEFKERYDTNGLEVEKVSLKGMPFFKQLRKALQERRKFDAIIYHSTTPPRLNFIKQSFLLCDFPATYKLSFMEKFRLRRWKTIWVNSDFTASWVKRYWNRGATVLHPPVKLPATASLEKNLDILSIGRFHGGSRSKRQDIIIEAFKKLPKETLEKTTLHLVGFVQDTEYLAKLKEGSQGFPVKFHENISLKEKEQLLKQCGFYVHACGFGIDENKDPILTEHYGIAVVEALANGCVPLVVPKGGPAHIVKNNLNGLHWEDIDHLATQLKTVLHDQDLQHTLREKGISDSENYAFEALFNKLRLKFA